MTLLEPVLIAVRRRVIFLVTVHAFYVKYLLPIWFDVQAIESAPGSEPARRWSFA